ncbi:hypothetical protein LOAG_02102 [Loa loa]|uniref:Kinesin motor domain-containing protein n=1 Tax=Loa loa TaxID=7209 RepID=A0A1I7VPU8_LOALO|nr:hypothetical protein LOAG_02102 [Loa loa]EFO26382.1 hypothetical protein LOAG_02102 [Loa loa]
MKNLMNATLGYVENTMKRLVNVTEVADKGSDKRGSDITHRIYNINDTSAMIRINGTEQKDERMSPTRRMRRIVEALLSEMRMSMNMRLKLEVGSYDLLVSKKETPTDSICQN